MTARQEQAKPVSPQLVCGRQMTAESANTAQYRGQTIYFCTSVCLEAFQADPDRFYKAHSKTEKSGQA